MNGIKSLVIQYLQSKDIPINNTNKRLLHLWKNIFNEDMNKIIDAETITLYMINQRIRKAIKPYESDPNGGMIGQFTEIIYNKHFKAEFKKAIEGME